MGYGLALSSTVPLPGRMTVRKLSDLGAMGVRRKASVSGCDIGPPADNEYAVDPVGVDNSNPSAYKLSFKPSSFSLTWGEWTHDSFGQVLTIKVGVDNGQMWIPSSMKGHLIHHLPTSVSDLMFSPLILY